MRKNPPGNKKGWQPPATHYICKEDKAYGLRFNGKRDEEGNEIAYEESQKAVLPSRETAVKIVKKYGQGPYKIELGCGDVQRPGYIGIDIAECVNPDLVINIEKAPLPFDDNSVEEIVCHHVLEHLHDLIAVMNECQRVLKPGGKMVINVPIYPSVQAFQDPTHVRFFTQQSFPYFHSADGLWQTVGKNYGIKPFSHLVQQVISGWELVAVLRK